MRTIQRLRTVLHVLRMGFTDGWAQPHSLNFSWNVSRIETLSENTAQELLDRGINLGQLARAGLKSETWQEGYWPVKSVRRWSSPLSSRS